MTTNGTLSNWHENIGGLVFDDPLEGYFLKNGEMVKSWNGLSRINLIVGPNNSGKSKFIRAVMMSYMRSIPDVINNDIRSSIKDNLSLIREFMIDHGVTTINGLTLEDLSDLHHKVQKILGIKDESEKKAIWQRVVSVHNSIFSFAMEKDQKSDLTPFTRLKELAISGFKEISREVPPERKVSNYSINITDNSLRVYIPVLRGLRYFDTQKTDHYADRVRKDYGITEDIDRKIHVFTGLKLHEELTNQLLGNLKQRDEIAFYQKFLSEKIFENQSVVLIPAPNKQIIIKIGEEQEQEIHHLGDGLQSIITLTYMPFVNSLRDLPTMFFIEEPELFLHPGSQRRIIEIFDNLKLHTYFITTHSNHMLDLTIDFPKITVTSIHKQLSGENTTEKKPQFLIETLDNDVQSTLALLGIRNSSVFLVNATIWVEGITDRWYFRKMLELYIKHLNKKRNPTDLPIPIIREDTHYSFVEYGGSNIVHYSFLMMEDHPINVRTLCADALIILDDDGGRNTKRKEALKNKLGDNAEILSCREVENLLPESVIRKVVAEYEGISEDTLPEFNYEDYRNKYLGTFIEGNILSKLKIKHTPRRKYRKSQTGAGTILDKRVFCEKALKYLNDYEVLPSTAKIVIENIYKHIIRLNLK